MSDELLHYGILRRSGRYPWGSGEDPYGRSTLFMGMVQEMKEKSGLSEPEIARAIGVKVSEITGNPKDANSFNVSHLRSTVSIAKEQIVLEETNRAVTLRDKGMSPKAISEKLNMPLSTVRLRLENSEKLKQSSLRNTAEVLRGNVDKHEIVDIGKGTSLLLNISPEKLKAAVALLHDEGYETYTLQTKNVGTSHFTNQKVLVAPGTGFGAAKRMSDRIHTMGEWTENEGQTFFGIHPPLSVSSKRLKVNFEEDGGTSQDGVVFVRPGVKDLDMGKNTYAQVRIMIDGTHYIKGMAVLNPDMPPGVDLVFNTNKSRSVGKMGALKPLKDDADNPFGSIIKRQILEVDPKTGKERVKSALNLVNEEGDWANWRDSIPSQMLSKQPHSLIKSQLQETRDQTKARLDEIASITHPVIRRKEMEAFADQIDADAVDLRAAAMPRQRTQVIIPMPKMAKNEIYAPNFETGEKVVLIRFPHGGQFEIPEVTVNNNNRTAKKLLANAIDAIGIHPSVAETLSGADFDGDTVLVIPNRQGKIKGSQALGVQARAVYEKNLNGFEPKRKYGGYVETDGVGNFPLMKNTGLEMGKITNLITDMSIQGAQPDHIVRAVKHSMVVIDAEKHKLNYKQSEIDNGIAQLKELYQGSSKAGATTLLSQATARKRVNQRKLRSMAEGGPIDPATGKKVYVETGKTTNKFDRKTGTYLDEKVHKQEEVKRLALVDNAFDLVRDPHDPVERLYAEHANQMKDLANKARLQASRTAAPKINTRAREEYQAEWRDLAAQLKAAQKQKPLERRADILAGITVKARRQEDPLLREDADRLKKVERQAKAGARAQLGLEKPVITISDRAWDAIMSGAVSSSMLREILDYADPKRIQELSLPRKNTVMTPAITARAKAMLGAGATNADVAAALGIPQATLRSAAQRGEL